MPQLERPIALGRGPSPLVRMLRMAAIAIITTMIFVFGVAIVVVATAD